MKMSLAARIAGLAIAFALSAALLPGAASAGTATGVMNVSASITQKCIMTTPATLAFGGYDPISTNASANLTATATITYQCTKGADTYGSPKPWLDLDSGANSGQVTVTCVGASSTTCTRAMKETNNGTDYLAYELYQDSAYTYVWGTGNPGGTQTSGKGFAVPTSGASQTVTVYAFVAKGQNPTFSASYADTVNMTLNY